eukprot:scaffold825_cov249-Pinguiococcus_pyrenoidosus.AAC.37
MRNRVQRQGSKRSHAYENMEEDAKSESTIRTILWLTCASASCGHHGFSTLAFHQRFIGTPAAFYLFTQSRPASSTLGWNHSPLAPSHSTRGPSRSASAPECTPIRRRLPTHLAAGCQRRVPVPEALRKRSGGVAHLLTAPHQNGSFWFALVAAPRAQGVRTWDVFT